MEAWADLFIRFIRGFNAGQYSIIRRIIGGYLAPVDRDQRAPQVLLVNRGRHQGLLTHYRRERKQGVGGLTL